MSLKKWNSPRTALKSLTAFGLCCSYNILIISVSKLMQFLAIIFSKMLISSLKIPQFLADVYSLLFATAQNQSPHASNDFAFSCWNSENNRYSPWQARSYRYEISQPWMSEQVTEHNSFPSESQGIWTIFCIDWHLSDFFGCISDLKTLNSLINLEKTFLDLYTIKRPISSRNWNTFSFLDFVEGWIIDCIFQLVVFYHTVAPHMAA